jgi:hypothetical protein
MYPFYPSGSLSQEEMVLFMGGQLRSRGIAVFRQLAIIAWRNKSTGTHAPGQII